VEAVLPAEGLSLGAVNVLGREVVLPYREYGNRSIRHSLRYNKNSLLFVELKGRPGLAPGEVFNSNSQVNKANLFGSLRDKLNLLHRILKELRLIRTFFVSYLVKGLVGDVVVVAELPSSEPVVRLQALDPFPLSYVASKGL
jgi:hypothetical protein